MSGVGVCFFTLSLDLVDSGVTVCSFPGSNLAECGFIVCALT